jgi:hypothetical protein
LIAFDSEITTEKGASINANRNFVLLPIQDLNLDWKHPILQKKIAELILLSPDKSVYDCSRFTKSSTNIALEQFNYVAEGNIGAGKTTLATKFLRILMQNSFERLRQSFYLNFIKIKTDTRFHLKCHFGGQIPTIIR